MCTVNGAYNDMRLHLDDEIFVNRFSINEWQDSKREEMLNLILKEEYGFRPKELNKKLRYEVEEEAYLNNIHIRKVAMYYSTYKMRFYLYTPQHKKHVKAFVLVLHEYAYNLCDKDLVNNYKSCTYCDIDNVINRGYAVALLITKDIAPDKKVTSRRGLITYLHTRKTSSSWGTLQAWSWGTSKVLDYFYTLNDEIDVNKVAVIGHSRGGKTALLAASQDQRFILSISSCSGNSGAALARNNTGETIKDITNNFGYWFCKNYNKYADKEAYLPFDQHNLIGLIAPRYVYVFSASEDSWACPKNELEASRRASQYFELYGHKGLVAPTNIERDVSYNSGHIAYHIKTGKHNIETRDWNMVMDYFDKI